MSEEKSQTKAEHALDQSVRILKNTINIILKTKHDGKDIPLINEALVFMDKLIEQNLKLKKELQEQEAGE